MKAWSLVFGYFCINMAIWTLNIAGILPSYTREAIINPTGLESLFSLDTFTLVTGIVGGGVVGILAMITRNYALSTGVLILWLVGVMLKPIRDLLIGLPLLIEAVLPPSVWFFSQVFVAFSAMILFVFIVEIIAGRPIS